MSKLPPLPQATERCWVGSITSGNWEGLIRESVVREYGQQCRDAAIDDVADAMMKSDLSGLAKDHYLLSYTAQLMLSWVTYIRTLKNEQTTIKASA